MTHDELLAKIDQIIAFEALRPIKENIWEIGGYLSALALRAVVKLHKPDSNGICDLCDGQCWGCGEWGCEWPKCECECHPFYPCPTIQAIEKELA